MRVNKVISCILLLLTIILAASCTGQNQSQSDKPGQNTNRNNLVTTAENGTKAATKPTITVQFIKGSDDIEKGINIFQYENFDVAIEYTPIEYDSKTSDAFSSKLLLDLNSGGGPDIMIFDRNLFKSLRKAAGSGVFYNLDEFFKTDRDMDLSSFNRNIFDCGVINDSRYFVPLRSLSSVFMTTNSILKNNNININYENWTWKDLLTLSESFSVNRKKEAKYLFSYPFEFIDLVNSFGKPFVDYEKGKSNFNNDELKEALQLYRKLYRYAPETNESDTRYSKSNPEGLKNKSFVLKKNNVDTSAVILIYVDWWFREELDDRLVIIPYPSWYGNGYVSSTPQYLFGINNKCKEKAYACKLLKFFLSEDSQTFKGLSPTTFNYLWGNPVRKQAIAWDIETLGSSGLNELMKPFSETFNSEFTASYGFLLNNSSSGIGYDKRIIDSVSEASKKYLEDKMTEEEALEMIDNEAELFLNE